MPTKKGKILIFKNLWGGHAVLRVLRGNVVPTLRVDKNWFQALKLGIKLGTEITNN